MSIDFQQNDAIMKQNCTYIAFFQKNNHGHKQHKTSLSKP